MFFIRVHKNGGDKLPLPSFGPKLPVRQFSVAGAQVLLATGGVLTTAVHEADRLFILDALNPQAGKRIDLSSLSITEDNYEDLMTDELFVLVLVDLAESTITLARNVSTIRQIYYRSTKSDFWAASNPGLLRQGGCRFEVNESVLPEFYTYRTLLAPNTLVTDVRKLAAGELIVGSCFDPSSIKSYYPDFSFVVDPSLSTVNEAGERMEAILSGHIAATLRHDENPATLLSGGLDSSLLASITRRHTDRLQSYSSDFSFLNRQDQESEYATTVADHLKIKHTICGTTSGEFLQAVIDSIAVAGEPLHHLQTVLLYLLFHKCRTDRHRIFLCGLGADGFFGGTLHSRTLRFPSTISLLKQPWTAGIIRPLARLAARFDSRFDFFNHGFGDETVTADHILWTIGSFGDVDFIRHFLTCDRADITRSHRQLMLHYREHDMMDKVTILSLLGGTSTTMPLWGQLAESAGLILLYPFTSPELIACFNTVPWSVKGQGDKGIIKDILDRHGLPAEYINRPKLSFGFPPQYWALPGALFQPLVDMAAEMFDPSLLRSLQVVDTGRAMVLWNMINFYLWHRMFIDGEAAENLKYQLNQRCRQRHGSG